VAQGGSQKQTLRQELACQHLITRVFPRETDEELREMGRENGKNQHKGRISDHDPEGLFDGSAWVGSAS
jgi:hypothetical protein